MPEMHTHECEFCGSTFLCGDKPCIEPNICPKCLEEETWEDPQIEEIESQELEEAEEEELIGLEGDEWRFL